MDVKEMQRMLIDFKASMISAGFLNDQFTQLQQTQDESDPNFVRELVTMFFDESEKFLEELATALLQDNVEFENVNFYVYSIKGSSITIGAPSLTNICIPFLGFCKERKLEECLRCLNQLQKENIQVKNKFEHLFSLEKRIIEAGGSIPKEYNSVI